MNNINLNFFENYKKLEKLCNEILSVNNGVTQYINEMENMALNASIIKTSFKIV